MVGKCGVGPDKHLVFHRYAIPQVHARFNRHTVSDAHVIFNEAKTVQIAIRSDGGTLQHDRVLPNHSAFANVLRLNFRSRVNLASHAWGCFISRK